MNRLRNSSFDMSYVRRQPQLVLDEDISPCVSTDDEVDQGKKKDGDSSPYNSLWSESDLTRKKINNRLGRLEELNRMIEDRLKKMVYSPEGTDAADAVLRGKTDQYPVRSSLKRREVSTERVTSKSSFTKQPLKKKEKLLQINDTWQQKKEKRINPEDGVNINNVSSASLFRKPKKTETFREFMHPQNKVSDFSFEKVLGLCRAKLQSLDCRHYDILDQSVKKTPKKTTALRKKPPNPNRVKIEGTISPFAKNQSITSFSSTPPNVSILLTAQVSNHTKPSNDRQRSIDRLQSSHQLQLKSQVMEILEPPPSKKPNKDFSMWNRMSLKASKTETNVETSKINEILKGHAQKVSQEPNSCFQVKDYIVEFQEMASPKSNRIAKKIDQKMSDTKAEEKKVEADTKDEKVQETKPAISEKKKDEGEKEVQESEKNKAKSVEENVKVPPSEGSGGNKDTPEEKPGEAEGSAKTEKEGALPPQGSSPEDNKKSPCEKKTSNTDKVVSLPKKEESAEEASKKKVQEIAMTALTERMGSPFKAEGLKKSSSSSGGPAPLMPKQSLRTAPQNVLLGSMVESLKARIEKKDVSSINSMTSEPSLKNRNSRSGELRDLVNQAIKDHKIFCIFDNHWYIVKPVREELLSRGWLEVIPDKRLIPRRRPPPAGPTLERNIPNDYGIEAILTAKEAFADDVSDIIAKSIAFKPLQEKTRIMKKHSDESLRDTVSEFRIVPPSNEKKKNNVEIREFVVKCQNLDVGANLKSKDKKGRKVLGSKNKDGATTKSEHSNSTVSEKKIDTSSNQDGESMSIMYKTASNRLIQKESNNSEMLVKGSPYFLTENESKIASKIIQSSNGRIHFMWLSIKPGIHLKCFNYSPEIVNKFQKTTFCTKIGLWSHLNNIQWYAHEVNYPAKSPRMYNTGEADDLQAFFQDFQMTACIGILKWLSETFFDKGIKGVQRKKGKVPIKAFEFAIKQCERYIRFRDNDDLNFMEEPKVLQEEWNTFLQWFYVITNDHGKVQETSNAQLMVVYTKAVEVLRAMKRYWPEIDVDGRLNIWIMKPYCASCGRGIFMTNNVYYIGQHSKYIVQKYIERPLLIYNTKFDIRQWFMITKLIPLEIWMYKECYLRFCTQPFALRNLHESVHLSNNSVQRKYVSQRDPSLPDQNMWDSNTFQQYLKTIGQPNAWNEVIYPGMRDAIISIMLAAQDTFDSQRKSWFEVYGADFMISSNLKDGPWLIEINENPAMDPSTKVTARLCPQMLRDVIKVVVDKRTNKNALTGQWELVYRQNYSPSYGSIDLDVKGKRIARVTRQPFRTSYSNNATHPPPFFLSCMAKKDNNNNNDREQESKRQYEIVKSYNVKRGKGTLEDESNERLRTRSSFWKHGKARVSTEKNNSCTEKTQVQMNKKLSGQTKTSKYEISESQAKKDAMISKFVEISLHKSDRLGSNAGKKKKKYNEKLMESLYLQTMRSAELKERNKNGTIYSISRQEREWPGKMGPIKERRVVNNSSLTQKISKLGENERFTESGSRFATKRSKPGEGYSSYFRTSKSEYSSGGRYKTIEGYRGRSDASFGDKRTRTELRSLSYLGLQRQNSVLEKLKVRNPVK